MKETMIEAVKTGGKIVKEYHENKRDISMKSYKEFVTKADIDSEKAIVDVIRKNHPKHSINSEEMGKENKDSLYTWIIDPLDGTHNYIFSLPYYAVSVAVAKEKDVVMGAVYLPSFDELYFAEKGKGAFLNEEPVKVSSRDSMINSLIFYDNQFYNEPHMLPNLGKVAERDFTTRILGSACCDLSLVAKGCADARILHKPKACDFAAGALIVEEAGGKVTDFQGKPWNTDTKQIIASNGKIHDELLEVLK